MKKHAKILCAILVIATLCASLLFTVGAAENEPFVESFKITDFAGKSITGGNDYKSSVDGNRVSSVSTLNAGNSSFISIAKGESDNPYVVAYANQTYSGKPTSNNNLGISVDTATSAPFNVVGDGAKGYYVIDFDVATHGNWLPGIDVSVVMRRESDGTGFPFSDEIYIGGYVTEKDAWSHITIVGDIKNNVAKVYVNGVFAGDAGAAVRTSSDSGVLANDTKVTARGFRIELTRNNVQSDVINGENTAFDNFSHRLYISDGDELTNALSDGNITDWSGYTSGRGGELLPVVATVDGAEFRNFSKVSQTFNTNDTVDVEFLAKPLSPIDVCVNANINTNGIAYNQIFNVVNGCTITSVDGNMVYTKAPFVSNYVEKTVNFSGYSASSANINEIYNATRGSAKGNLYDRFNIVTASSLKNINTLGYRSSTIISDSVTGNSIYRESANVAAGSTTTKEQNEYSNFNFSKVYLSYEAGKNEYIVVDFDYTYTGELDSYLQLLIIPRGSNGYHAAGMQIKNLNITEGEMVHITAVHDYTNNTAQYFINGVLTNTVNGGAINSSAHSKYLNKSEEIRVEEYKLGSNSLNTVYFSNMNIRFFDINAATDTLSAAINAKDITLWSDNIYTSDYEIAKFPSLATVDGEFCYGEAELETVLFGNKVTPAVVKILHAFDQTITVNCDAIIYTYGQDVKFVDVNGNPLVPDKNGIIRLDVAYMPIRSEVNVDVVGGSDSAVIYDAIKLHTEGNLLSSVVPSVGNWGAQGYRNSSLVTNLETGDVLYRNSALLNVNGSVNADSTEYVDMKFTSHRFLYSSSTNAYIVVDFDFATDGALNDDVAVVLVPGSEPLLLKDLGILDGDSAHVTVVYDFNNNYAYAFVNGLFACSVEGGAVANYSSYLVGSALNVDSFRLSTEGKTSAVCLDNVAIRSFSYSSAEDTLLGTVASGSLTGWEGNLYTAGYKVSKIPTLAVVDGREYGSLDTVNKLLAIKTNYVKTVELKYAPAGAVKIRTESVVETNGLGAKLDWNTGLYQFDPGIERYRGTRTGLAYSSTQFIYTTVGTVYTFKTINADNCWNNASVAVWSYKVSRGIELSFEDYDVVFYPYGEQMAPIDNGIYILDGKRVNVSWKEMHITGSNSYERVDVTEYPVAGSTVEMKFYIATIGSSSASYAATDMLYSANISTGIEFIFYVNKSQTVTDTGKVVTIDGKEYVAFVYHLAPHEIDKVITVSFEVRSGSNVYTQKQDICFLDYVRQLLEENVVDKSLIVSLLDYANESHILFEGSEMEGAAALIEENKEYLTSYALTEKLDTSALRDVIRSASLKLSSTPEFVFRVARGFRGTVTISYNSCGEAAEQSYYVNSLACEQIIILDGMGVYDFASDITITITPYGSDTSVTGQYNLATYVQGLEENDEFAVALYNYAKAALQYRMDAETPFPV